MLSGKRRHKKLKVGIGGFMDDVIESRFVHIKTAPYGKEDVRHYYWDKKNYKVVTSGKVSFPVVSIAPRKYRKACDSTREEFQIGDSVVWVFGKAIQPFVCATITGVFYDRGKKMLYLSPNNSASKFPESSVFYESHRCYFISNNLRDRKIARANKVFAAYEDELEFIEIFVSGYNSPKVMDHFLTQRIPLGEKALKYIHKELFGVIYDWAGIYRADEVVVGRRENPTLHPSELQKEISDFFSWFSVALRACNGDKSELCKVITRAHRELAWIHPFSDGNGRSIRLFLEVVIRSRGFDYNLGLNKLGKKKYHYAVRSAIKGNSRLLASLVSRSIVDQ